MEKFNLTDLNASQLRKLYGYTQQEIADSLNISKQHYGSKELSKYTVSMEEFYKLSKLFNLSIETLQKIYGNGVENIFIKNLKQSIDNTK